MIGFFVGLTGYELLRLNPGDGGARKMQLLCHLGDGCHCTFTMHEMLQDT